MNELEKAYMTMQNACCIEAGDTVKVLRKAASNELGWNNGWADKMDLLIGKEAEVEDIFESGISLKCETVTFDYPFFVLEKIPKPHWRDTVSPENPVLCYAKDNENRAWSTRILLVSAYEGQKEINYPYSTGGNVYKYAKRVPKSVIESMLKAYDETSEDE